MTCEEWNIQFEKGLVNVNIKHILWDWQNDRVDLLKLLRAVLNGERIEEAKEAVK